MRVATYNTEWFDSLFDDAGALRDDDGPSGREGVTRHQQIHALGRVFGALDADAVLVVEAPDTNRTRSTVRALETFAQRFGLRARRALIGFASDTQQEIALLYNPDLIDAWHDPWGPAAGHAGAKGAPRFDGTFRLDLDIDARPEIVRFSKPPLEAALRLRETGRELRLIGVHIKSKSPGGQVTPDEARRIAIQNRRKQMAQCIWLRARVDEVLDAGQSLIVAGDFNDGPGLDEYEKLFGRSGVEVVMGEDGPRALYDPHARLALSRRVGAMPTTARFYLREQHRYLQALLDYIMISADLCKADPRWRIWHPFDDEECYRHEALREALLTASDHFPVTLDLAL